MGKYAKKSVEEKLCLIALCEKSTILSVARSNDVSYQSLKNWVDRFNLYGKDGLNAKATNESDSIVKNLHKENEQLKLIIAEKELELRIKNELLKKTTFQNQSK